MTKIKNFFKTMFTSFGKFVKCRWACFVGIIFTWVIPIIMLNEIIALAENVKAGFKLTWIGAIVAVVVILALRKKIYALIHKMKHGWVRGVLLTLYKAVGYAFLLIILWGISKISTKLYTWWLYSGISMLIGAIFYIMDEVLQTRKQKMDGGK